VLKSLRLLFIAIGGLVVDALAVGALGQHRHRLLITPWRRHFRGRWQATTASRLSGLAVRQFGARYELRPGGAGCGPVVVG
jgi:hypothetical protein